METKKDSKADLEKKRPLFMQIGLVVSLATTLVAFEWTTYETSNYQLGELTVDMEEEELIPITQREIAPPPKPKIMEQIKVVEDDKDIVDVEIPDIEFDPNAIIIFEEPEEVEVKEKKIFTIVEQMPSFPGGEKQLLNYLQKNTKYPAMAKDVGISGVVYVNFVIDENGNIINANVLGGIGGGCDEEALRVVNKMPKWKPGEQRGKKVNVSYNLPIKFTLK